MHARLVAGQALTREAIEAARVPERNFLRDEGAFKVYVACNRCGGLVTTWVTPRDSEAPFRYCDYCEWSFEHE